jgi:hypothetical protein
VLEVDGTTTLVLRSLARGLTTPLNLRVANLGTMLLLLLPAAGKSPKLLRCTLRPDGSSNPFCGGRGGWDNDTGAKALRLILTGWAGLYGQ